MAAVHPAAGEPRPDGRGEPDLLAHWEGEPVPVLEALWGVPLLEAHGAVSSTNDRLSALARAGALPFTVVLAEEQTAGRGRGGKPWSSPRGLGLWLSVLLGPAPAAARSLVPLLVGLAVCRAVDDVLGRGEADGGGAEAMLKWPNDVLLGERKVCGILCEGVTVRSAGSSRAGRAGRPGRPGRPGGTGGDGRHRVVAGIGLNVGQLPSDFPEEIRGRAVSLAMVAGRPVSRKDVAGRILGGVRQLAGRPTLRLDGDVAQELARRDLLRGRRVEVDGARGGGGGPLRGVARGVDPDGRLRVEAEDGVETSVLTGSVRVLDGPGHGDREGNPGREAG